jgi:hypothetical protein
MVVSCKCVGDFDEEIVVTGRIRTSKGDDSFLLESSMRKVTKSWR